MFFGEMSNMAASLNKTEATKLKQSPGAGGRGKYPPLLPFAQAARVQVNSRSLTHAYEGGVISPSPYFSLHKHTAVICA